MIPPIALKIGAIGLILGATYISGCVRGSEMANDRIQRITEDYANFRINTEIVGKAAQRDADAIKATNEARKAASDESYSKALSVLGADLERLRRARSSTDYLPPAPADTKCPEGWACFNRAELQQAIRQLDEGVSGILAEGDSVRLRLDTAIRWAGGVN